mmetsp:Transcript_5935/g.15086  ORF Transcript_5935/g.15086 Transcript_5935/m.15086 type:complete len:1218 (+) Transcript_5935:99-3752(+)|eukprot:CAMPEP_0177659784 /NCGR_PEP_ID=MMETSP0447-20121125/17638_1 /TAXON_ID=0 /ORGANISM="Stygamoeba regulata, Strain BSH-02190019" /LENGTH=1217 /DNA_ID=CAMNT_0019164699 /DNA_START=86 /DNA_END=3739 /DNA_ORIENTATION=-
MALPARGSKIGWAGGTKPFMQLSASSEKSRRRKRSSTITNALFSIANEFDSPSVQHRAQTTLQEFRETLKSKDINTASDLSRISTEDLKALPMGLKNLVRSKLLQSPASALEDSTSDFVPSEDASITLSFRAHGRVDLWSHCQRAHGKPMSNHVNSAHVAIVVTKATAWLLIYEDDCEVEVDDVKKTLRFSVDSLDEAAMMDIKMLSVQQMVFHAKDTQQCCLYIETQASRLQFGLCIVLSDPGYLQGKPAAKSLSEGLAHEVDAAESSERWSPAHSNCLQWLPKKEVHWNVFEPVLERLDKELLGASVCRYITEVVRAYYPLAFVQAPGPLHPNNEVEVQPGAFISWAIHHKLSTGASKDYIDLKRWLFCHTSLVQEATVIPLDKGPVNVPSLLNQLLDWHSTVLSSKDAGQPPSITETPNGALTLEELLPFDTLRTCLCSFEIGEKLYKRWLGPCFEMGNECELVRRQVTGIVYQIIALLAMKGLHQWCQVEEVFEDVWTRLLVPRDLKSFIYHYSQRGAKKATQALFASQDMLLHKALEARLEKSAPPEMGEHVLRPRSKQHGVELGNQRQRSAQQETACDLYSIDMKHIHYDVPFPEDPRQYTEFIETVVQVVTHQGQVLGPSSALSILEKCKQQLLKEEGIMEVMLDDSAGKPTKKEVFLIGDLHGQLDELCYIIGKTQVQRSPNRILIFNGDVIDRGLNNVSCFLIAAALKACFPERVFINRGNHEDENMMKQWGTWHETMLLYEDEDEKKIFKAISECCDLLPLATIVNKHIFTVHGGLAANEKGEPIKVEEMRKVLANGKHRVNTSSTPKDSIHKALTWNVVHPGPARKNDLMYAPSSTVGVFKFNAAFTNRFLDENGLLFVVRSQELPSNGISYEHSHERYDKFHPFALATVWSSSEYPSSARMCGMASNCQAAMMRITRSASGYECKPDLWKGKDVPGRLREQEMTPELQKERTLRKASYEVFVHKARLQADLASQPDEIPVDMLANAIKKHVHGVNFHALLKYLNSEAYSSERNGQVMIQHKRYLDDFKPSLFRSLVKHIDSETALQVCRVFVENYYQFFFILSAWKNKKLRDSSGNWTSLNKEDLELGLFIKLWNFVFTEEQKAEVKMDTTEMCKLLFESIDADSGKTISISEIFESIIIAEAAEAKDISDEASLEPSTPTTKLKSETAVAGRAKSSNAAGPPVDAKTKSPTALPHGRSPAKKSH